MGITSKHYQGSYPFVAHFEEIGHFTFRPDQPVGFDVRSQHAS